MKKVLWAVLFVLFVGLWRGGIAEETEGSFFTAGEFSIQLPDGIRIELPEDATIEGWEVLYDSKAEIGKTNRSFYQLYQKAKEKLTGLGATLSWILFSGKPDNRIIANIGSARRPRYLVFGTFSPPAGYSYNEEYSAKVDSREKSYYYDADDPETPVQHFYVSGVVRELTAREQMEQYLSFPLFYEAGSVQQEKISGLDTVWIAGIVDDEADTSQWLKDVPKDTEAEKTPIVTGHGMLTLYTDTVEGYCIVVMLETALDLPAQEIPDLQLLRDALPEILEGLKLP